MRLKDESFAEIYDLLYRLGLSANYNGFFYLAYAVWLTIEEPDRLLLVTKWLYPDVAKQFHTSWKAVERGIRYAVLVIWSAESSVLPSILRMPLQKKPKAAAFIAALSSYCSQHKAA